MKYNIYQIYIVFVLKLVLPKTLKCDSFRLILAIYSISFDIFWFSDVSGEKIATI